MPSPEQVVPWIMEMEVMSWVHLGALTSSVRVPELQVKHSFRKGPFLPLGLYLKIIGNLSSN